MRQRDRWHARASTLGRQTGIGADEPRSWLLIWSRDDEVTPETAHGRGGHGLQPRDIVARPAAARGRPARRGTPRQSAPMPAGTRQTVHRRRRRRYRIRVRSAGSRTAQAFRPATSGLSTLNEDQIAERGARMARRDDREYREYLREEQRRQPGCPAREVVLDQREQATSPATRSSGRTSACSIPARRTISRTTPRPVRTCRDGSTSDRRPVEGPRRPAEERLPAARK